MPEGSRRARAATHQAIMSFTSAYALLGTYFTFGPLRIRASTAAVRSPWWYLAAKAGQIGVFEHGYAPSGTLRAGDNNSRVGAQQVGAEQPDSQLMMTNERGLSRLTSSASAD
jgi:hypothetical protein